MQSHFNALKFDNVWQLRPSSSNSFSGETFATRQAFESKLRINWKCKVLFESAILHMSGRQNVGSSKQSYCQNSTGTGFIIFNSHIFLTYLQKYRKSSVWGTGAPAEAFFQTLGTASISVAWLAGLYGLMFVGFLGVFFMLHVCSRRLSSHLLVQGLQDPISATSNWGPASYRKCKKQVFCSNWTNLSTTPGHSERNSDKSRSRWDLVQVNHFKRVNQAWKHYVSHQVSCHESALAPSVFDWHPYASLGSWLQGRWEWRGRQSTAPEPGLPSFYPIRHWHTGTPASVKKTSWILNTWWSDVEQSFLAMNYNALRLWRASK